MKVNFDIECTPEEARKFLGLPDVAPLQEAMMKEMQARMQEAARSMEPEAIMKTWLPMTMQNMTDMQKMFWAQMGVNPKDGKKK
ncbi:MAG: hypothetical protein KDI46_06235 [Alphaproteobacteria bacterium]|nr:hypothetical protein [Alphaproteobacteria bacterium]